MADTIQPKDLQPARPQGTQKPQGTGFTNIQKLIGANQGNQLGNAVAGGIQKATNQVGSQVANASQDYNKQLQANSLNNPQNQQAAQGLITKATDASNTDATGGNITDADVAQAQKFASGQYGGPTELQNSSYLQGQAQNVQDLGKLGGTPGGRQGLLQRFVGAPQYNQGQQRLDSLLLGSNPTALNQARAATQGVSSQVNKAVEGSRAQGQQAQNAAAQFGQDFQKQLSDKTTGINKQVADALAAAKQKDTATSQNYNDVTSKLLAAYQPNASGGFGTGETADSRAASVINSANLDPSMKQELQNVVSQAAKAGVNPTSALNNILQLNGQQNDSSNGIMNQQQAASLNALAKLSGQSPTDFGTIGNYKGAQIGNKLLGNGDSVYNKSSDLLNNITGFKAGVDPSLQQFSGAGNKEFLAQTTGSPDKAFQNPDAVKQLLTPDEFAKYQEAKSGYQTVKGPFGNYQKPLNVQEQSAIMNPLQKSFTDRANQAYAGIQANDAQLAGYKKQFEDQGY